MPTSNCSSEEEDTASQKGVKESPHCPIPNSLSFIHQALQQLPQAFVIGQVEPFNQIDNTHPSKALELWG